MINIRHLIIPALLTMTSVQTICAEKLVIMHTNDTHSQIDPVAEDGLGGVARRKVLIDSIRDAHPGHSLLVDAGDIVQGTLFFNLYKGEVEEKLMNALGYDMRVLGNHEFDNGMQALADNLKNANANLLASNYQMRGTSLEGMFMPYDIREFDGKRIAFMPINLNPKGMISDSNVEGMGYIDGVEAANHLAWYLKNIEQADIVVALTHIGYIENEKPDDMQLVKNSKDIDVIIGGHSHTTIDPSNPKSVPHIVKNAEGRDVLVAQTGKSGKYLGEITIDLDSIDAIPQYQVIRVDSRLDSRTDPAIEEIISPYRAEVDNINRITVAKTKHMIAKDSPELLNYISDFVAARGKELAGNIDMAIMNKGGLRNSLPKGDVTKGDIITLMPFFNRVAVIDITGENLAKAFDVMAAAGGNGVSEGVEATYVPGSGKCTTVTINGRPIDPARTYRVATIDYLANGGDYMSSLADHEMVAVSPNIMFEDLLEHLQKAKGKNKTISAPEKRRMTPVN